MCHAQILAGKQLKSMLKVLVIEDEDAIAETLQIDLTSLKYKVQVARNFQKAFEILSQNKIDIVFLSRHILQQAAVFGPIDLIQKPVSRNDVIQVLKRMSERREDSIHEIMDIVQCISWIRLGSDKRPLVETRLMRRARALNLNSIENYKEYFQYHRESEVHELISTVTTHTTSFFRVLK